MVIDYQGYWSDQGWLLIVRLIGVTTDCQAYWGDQGCSWLFGLLIVRVIDFYGSWSYQGWVVWVI